VVRGLVDFARQLVFRLGERALRRIVEHVELLGADGFAVEDRKRLHPAVDRTNAEAERLGDDFEIADHRAVLRLELPGELRLGALELLAFDDGGDLFFQLLDQPLHRGDEGGAGRGREDQGPGRLGMRHAREG